MDGGSTQRPTDGGRASSSWSKPGEMLERLQARPPAETRYDLREEIARGGMGAILRVWDGDLRRAIAMKVALGRESSKGSSGPTPGSSLDDRTLGRFLEEAQITAQLDHPGIVPVHELGLDSSGQVFFTMALVQGVHLGVVLRHLHGDKLPEGAELPDGEWTQTRMLGVLLKVCEAMAYAHAKGVLHRDLKPANIMVGDFGQVYVMDWGLARVMEVSDKSETQAMSRIDPVSSSRREAASESSSPLLTMDGDVVGTPAYMSPEQARAEWSDVGPQTDVYAIGSILYHALAGHMPYGSRRGPERPGVEVWKAVRSGAPTPLARIAPDVSPELVAICEKAMERDPDRRYPNTRALGDDLRAYLEGRVVSAWRTGPLVELRKWVSRNRALAATAALGLFTTLGGLVAVGWVQLRANDLLEERNEELSVARAESERQAGLLRLDGMALREARAATERALEEARQEAYGGSIVAAALSLEAGNLEEVRRQLDACPEDLRGWEWSYHDLAQDGSLMQPGGLEGDARRSPSTRLVGPRTEPSGLEEGIRSARYSPDGQQVLVDFLRLGLVLLEPESGARQTLDGAGPGDKAGCFSADGQRVLRVARDGSVVLHRRSDGSTVRVLDEKLGAMMSLDPWSTTESSGFVALTAAGELWSWDEDGELLAEKNLGLETLFGQQSQLLDSSMASGAPRMAMLLVGGSLVTVELPGLDRSEAVMVDQLVQRLSMHPSGSRVALYTVDGRLGELDLEGRGSRSWKEPAPGDIAVGMKYGASGDTLVVAYRDQSVRVLSSPGLELLRVPAQLGGLPGFTLDPTGRTILTYKPQPVRVWHSLGRRGATPLAVERPVRELELHPRGERIALLTLGAREVRLFDGMSGDPLPPFGHEMHTLQVMAFDRDWRRCALATSRGELSLWDPLTGERVMDLGQHDGRIQCLDFSPDGRALASGGRDGTLRLWDVERGRLLSILTRQTSSVHEVVFHPSGRAILWADSSGAVVYHDLSTRRSITVLIDQEAQVRDLVVSPDGSFIAVPVSDNAIQVVDLHDFSTRFELRGHTDAIASLCVLPDGRRIISSGDDGTIHVWDVASGRGLAVLKKHVGTVSGLASSSDGRRIVSGGIDEQVLVWDTQLEDARGLWDGEATRRAARRALVEGWLEGGSLDGALRSLRSDPARRELVTSAERLIGSWRTGTGSDLFAHLWRLAWTAMPGDRIHEQLLALEQQLPVELPEAGSILDGYRADLRALCLVRLARHEEAREALGGRRLRRDLGGRGADLPGAEGMERLRGLLEALMLAEDGDREGALAVFRSLRRPRGTIHPSVASLGREVEGLLTTSR